MAVRVEHQVVFREARPQVLLVADARIDQDALAAAELHGVHVRMPAVEAAPVEHRDARMDLVRTRDHMAIPPSIVKTCPVM